jgi:hypothetical protein
MKAPLEAEKTAGVLRCTRLVVRSAVDPDSFSNEGGPVLKNQAARNVKEPVENLSVQVAASDVAPQVGRALMDVDRIVP